MPVPKGLLALLQEEEKGSAGRRRVYGRLYSRVRSAGILPAGKHRVVWPLPVREAVRSAVEAEEGEAVAKYDDQHDTDPSVSNITLFALYNDRSIPFQPMSKEAQSEQGWKYDLHS